LLAEIVKYLKFNRWIHYERPRQSAPALANAARVSRLFYELAMPLLWEEVHLWRPSTVRPYTLIKYPWTAEHVSSYIRTMHLGVGQKHQAEERGLDKTELNRTRKFASRCLNILTAATSVKTLHLYVYMYNIDAHSTELRGRLKAINTLIFRILGRAESMELDEFGWHPGRETVCSSGAMRIIERKVTEAELGHLERGEWVDYLPNYERLKSIEVYNSRTENSTEFDSKFWMAIARLDNCTKVVNSDFPIPFGWNIQFKNLTSLDLLLFSPVHTSQWIRTIRAVFKYMPELKSLDLSSPHRISQDEIEGMEISDVVCKNLETLYFGGYSPSKLLITIGNQCPNLAHCYFNLHNINDDDLYALSQCRRIVAFSLRYPIPITNGLSRLTNLPQLAELDLHYSLGKYINTRLLLDFTRSCPRLDTIAVADFNRNTFNNPDPGPFETKAISELFDAGAELCAYFEPHYSPPSEWSREMLDKYIIRIDNLRRDKSSS
jgi:hypothetical protein